MFSKTSFLDNQNNHRNVYKPFFLHHFALKMCKTIFLSNSIYIYIYMVSYNSIKNFLYINSFIISIGWLEFGTINYFQDFYFFNIFFVFLVRNYFLIHFIDFNLKNKESINPNYLVKEDYNFEFELNLVSSTTIESMTYLFIKQLIYNNNVLAITYNDFLFFIPVSFVFEFVFDFFHYWTHRSLHLNKDLYATIHKKHHKYAYPTTILTFYQDPLDLIITNSIPQLITLCIFPYISLFEFNIILSYKSFIEISGHSSKKLYPNGSFSQFVWLPRLLDITLYAEDHTMHHSHNNCNYSKRFSFWDKLFGTYKETKDINNPNNND